MNSLKVAAHVHSEWSHDASWSLADLARAFARRGYDAVLMSEHDMGFDDQRWRNYKAACAAASTSSLLLVPGIEYADADNVVHLPVWGDVPFLGSGLCSTELLQRASSEGGFTVFAHPWRRDAWIRFTPEWLPNLSAVEIWNRKYDGWAPSRLGVELARDYAIGQFVSLDFHTRRQFFPLALNLDVSGPVTRDSVVEGLAAGSFTPSFMSRSALSFTGGAGELVVRALDQARRRAGDVRRRIRRVHD